MSQQGAIFSPISSITDTVQQVGNLVNMQTTVNLGPDAIAGQVVTFQVTLPPNVGVLEHWTHTLVQSEVNARQFVNVQPANAALQGGYTYRNTASITVNGKTCSQSAPVPIPPSVKGTLDLIPLKSIAVNPRVVPGGNAITYKVTLKSAIPQHGRAVELTMVAAATPSNPAFTDTWTEYIQPGQDSISGTRPTRVFQYDTSVAVIAAQDDGSGHPDWVLTTIYAYGP